MGNLPDKSDLRDTLLRARRKRHASEISAARTAIRATVLARVAVTRPGCVAAYVPLRTEPGSDELLDGLAALGIEVLVPVLLPDRDLSWQRWREDGRDLGTGAIATADLVLVPALAVARDGTRLGRGGGSYDRALARVPDGVPVAALLFDGELVESLPADSWDRPVAAVVTASGWTDLA